MAGGRSGGSGHRARRLQQEGVWTAGLSTDVSGFWAVRLRRTFTPAGLTQKPDYPRIAEVSSRPTAKQSAGPKTSVPSGALLLRRSLRPSGYLPIEKVGHAGETKQARGQEPQIGDHGIED